MKNCSCCGYRLEISLNLILDKVHSVADCGACDCMYVKSLITGEWIESSSINAQKLVGVPAGDKDYWGNKNCQVRTVAS
jgi:hypothetical protein